MKIIVRRTAGIGDSLAATVVADLLHEQGHEVVWQCHPEVIPIIKRHPTIVRVEPPRGHCDVNLDGCYENHPNARLVHFHDIFIMAAAAQLERIGVSVELNRPPKPPKLSHNHNNDAALLTKHPYLGLRVMVVPRSNYLTRCLPDSVWKSAMERMDGVVYWLGEHPAPPLEVSVKCRTIEDVADHISIADLVVTVDTGPMHIASAYGVPMVVISQSHDVHLRLSPLSDFEVVKRRDLDCLNCQRHRCPIDPYNPPCGQIDPQELADVVNRKLEKLQYDQVGNCH